MVRKLINLYILSHQIIVAYYPPGQDKEENRDAQIGSGHVDPDVQREWREEGEQLRRLLYGLRK